MTYLVGKHPFLTLKVRLPKNNRWTGLNCLIDTGFSGGIVLPFKWRDYFEPQKFIKARYLLADNSEVVVDTTYTKIKFADKQKEVAVVFMGDSEGLVGV